MGSGDNRDNGCADTLGRREWSSKLFDIIGSWEVSRFMLLPNGRYAHGKGRRTLATTVTPQRVMSTSQSQRESFCKQFPGSLC